MPLSRLSLKESRNHPQMSLKDFSDSSLGYKHSCLIHSVTVNDNVICFQPTRFSPTLDEFFFC